MKDLHGQSSVTVSTSPSQSLELLQDVAGYPRWYPDVVRQVEVLERDTDGRASQARVALHAAVGPIARDLQLVLTVSRRPGRVTLTRVPHKPTDPERFVVDWQVAEAGHCGSRIDLALEATLDVPRLVPLGGVGDSMAGGFVAAAARALDGPRS